jgi:hypothetical protein
MRTGVKFDPIADGTLLSPSGTSSDHPEGFGDPTKGAVETSLTAMLTSSTVAPSAVAGELDVFIQELTEPVERASVEATGRLANSIAMSGGKVAQVVPAVVLPATMQLSNSAGFGLVLENVSRICGPVLNEVSRTRTGTSWVRFWGKPLRLFGPFGVRLNQAGSSATCFRLGLHEMAGLTAARVYAISGVVAARRTPCVIGTRRT